MKARYNCFESFKEDLYRYESLDSFFYKLLFHVLICYDGKKYHFCDYYDRFPCLVCPLCYIPMYFYNFRHGIKKNCADVVLLACYRDKLFPFLTESFPVKESSIAAFAGAFF